MQGIIMSDATRMRSGKRAMLTAMTVKDKYRVGNGLWATADDAQPGQAADEVLHFGRHVTKVGDVLHVENDAGRGYGRIRIEGITLVESAALTDDQVHALGYDTRDDLAAAHSGYSDRRAWFVRFEPVKRWWEVWR